MALSKPSRRLKSRSTVAGDQAVVDNRQNAGRHVFLCAGDRGDHLARRPLASLDRAVQVALEVDRRVLAGEVAVPLARPLDPHEALVLADLPAGVRALRERVARPEVERRLAVVRGLQAREDGLDLVEELRSAGILR